MRQACELRPARKGRKLPRVLNAEDFLRFYDAVDRADDDQHSLAMRLTVRHVVCLSASCVTGK
ncbi:hypothetical protein [Gemmata obscuriglobus]|uniref:Uncharacterized protein n=1 Tax=Gemmata obscuriglobus TaxID=114 RepID=A0A2Z3GX92_9BACT|nr:hypothetical protein [Gemmata obscuriglobus]AWM39099.1 hypothetical protein C1280_20335 [Gemmata obscuriglobus]